MTGRCHISHRTGRHLGDEITYGAGQRPAEITSPEKHRVRPVRLAVEPFRGRSPSGTCVGGRTSQRHQPLTEERTVPVSRRPIIIAAAAALTISGAAFAAPAAGGDVAGSELESATNANADDLAIKYVREHADDLGVSPEDLRDVVVLSSYMSQHNGVTHVNLGQRFEGLEVFGGHATVNVTREGGILFIGNNFVAGLQEASSAAETAADLDAVEAVEAAAEELDLDEPVKVEVMRSVRATAGAQT